MKYSIVFRKVINKTDIYVMKNMLNFSFKRFILSALLVTGSISMLPGQSVSSSISDDELMQYAIVMDSITTLTEQLKVTLTGLIKKNPKISEARYTELSQLGGDQARLKEAKATPDELAALQEINLKRTEETIKLSETVKSLTNNTLGSSNYTKIRNAVKTDADVKARYDKLASELKKKPQP